MIYYANRLRLSVSTLARAHRPESRTSFQLTTHSIYRKLYGVLGARPASFYVLSDIRLTRCDCKHSSSDRTCPHSQRYGVRRNTGCSPDAIVEIRAVIAILALGAVGAVPAILAIVAVGEVAAANAACAVGKMCRVFAINGI